MNQVTVSPAQWLSRKVWGFLLWILRRPRIKRIRRRMIQKQRQTQMPEWMRIDVQDKVAMRYGRTLLTYCFGFLLYSLLFSGSYAVALELKENGAFEPPQSVKDQLDPNWAQRRASEALRQ